MSEHLEKQELLNEAEIYKIERHETEEQKYFNVLMLAMSTFPWTKRIVKSEFKRGKNDTKEPIIGRSQLDPVPKYLAEILQEDGEYLDQIMIFNSGETVREKEITTPEGTKEIISPADYFKKQVNGYMNPNNEKDHFKEYEVDVNNPGEKFAEAVKYLRNRAKEKPKLRVYMDTHGGLRGIQRVLEAMMILLEDEGIEIEDIYSVEMGENYIFSEKDRFIIFKFVSGIKEFRCYGRNTTLTNYLDDVLKQNEQSPDQELNGYIRQVAQGIQWCDVSTFEDGLQELGKFFNVKKELEIPYLTIFTDSIKNDYKKLLGKHTVIDEIEWCCEKGFYQQALTLLESRMSGNLVKQGILKVNGKYKEVKGKPGKYELKNVEYQREGREFTLNEIFNALIYSLKGKRLKGKGYDIFNQMEKCDYEEFEKYIYGKPSVKKEGKKYMNIMQSAEKDVNAWLKDGIENAAPNRGKNNYDASEFFVNNVKEDEKKTLRNLLVLHKTLKDVRNTFNHASEYNEYKPEKIIMALEAYVKWGKELFQDRDSSDSVISGSSGNTEDTVEKKELKKLKVDLSQIPLPKYEIAKIENVDYEKFDKLTRQMIYVYRKKFDGQEVELNELIKNAKEEFGEDEVYSKADLFTGEVDRKYNSIAKLLDSHYHSVFKARKDGAKTYYRINKY